MRGREGAGGERGGAENNRRRVRPANGGLQLLGYRRDGRDGRGGKGGKGEYGAQRTAGMAGGNGYGGYGGQWAVGTAGGRQTD